MRESKPIRAALQTAQIIAKRAGFADGGKPATAPKIQPRAAAPTPNAGVDYGSLMLHQPSNAGIQVSPRAQLDPSMLAPKVAPVTTPDKQMQPAWYDAVQAADSGNGVFVPGVGMINLQSLTKGAPTGTATAAPPTAATTSPPAYVNPRTGGNVSDADLAAKGAKWDGMDPSLATAAKATPVPINLPFKAGGAVPPTEAQKSAGNYRKGHVKFQGLDLSIENPKGSERSGKDRSGKKWSVKMPADYGYVKGTEGADGDHVDVYLGPHKDSHMVFVINQMDHKTGKFDEHKCMLGYRSEKEAVADYCKAFSDGKGPQRIGSIETISLDAFKNWLKHGKLSKSARAKSIASDAISVVRHRKSKG